MKTLINKLFKIFGLKIVKLDYFLYVQKLMKKYNFIRYLDISEKNNFKEIGNIFYKSKSENSQDIMVLDQLNFKKKWIFCRIWCWEWGEIFKYFLIRKKF